MLEAPAELFQTLLDALGKAPMDRLLLLAAFHRAAQHERLLAAVGSGAELGLHTRTLCQSWASAIARAHLRSSLLAVPSR